MSDEELLLKEEIRRDLERIQEDFRNEEGVPSFEEILRELISAEIEEIERRNEFIRIASVPRGWCDGFRQ